ncbi:MAG: methyltransferase domain-containing protein [Blastocatellia bacterium]|nr:methyltransferase domain-containing protein [Blastocatellia bacterium]
MSDSTRELDQLAQAMKSDWDGRARENAKWYINTAKHEQTEEEFDASGRREMEILVLPELALLTGGRDPRGLRLLEIGCGIGRMTKHLAAIFGEVHSTDVSGEMIAKARARLQALSNVRFHETSGVDFAALPDDSFDAVFSAYVFQHVPGKEVIVSNIRDAFRVARPGGILKLHTNGVEAAEYEALEKDTWAGATFSEREMRALARELGAQLVSVYGGGTGYCWTTLRKRIARPALPMNLPQIQFYARADDPAVRAIPTGGDDAWLALVATGLDFERVDANNLKVEIEGRAVTPRYVGRVRPHFEQAVAGLGEDRIYIEAGLPADVAPGVASVRIVPETDAASPAIQVELEAPKPPAPIIFTVRNAHDSGIDIHRQGPKSHMQISAVGLDPTATRENVRVLLGDRELIPDFVGFVTDIADYRVDLQVPADLRPGPTSLRLRFGRVESPEVMVEIDDDTEKNGQDGQDYSG